MPDPGYTNKTFIVTGSDARGKIVTHEVEATCRWAAVLAGRDKGIKETFEVLLKTKKG